MLFNSLQFAIFFAAVMFLYVGMSHKAQNRMLLVASYIFYGMWDWRFTALLAVSTVVDYFCGKYIYESQSKATQKSLLTVSVLTNLSILGFFKYFNFFIENFENLLCLAGINIMPRMFDIILPVGISFYTFQTMSYTIDIYKKEMVPTKNFWDLALYVSFFPQLVAGPIERATHLLPQILKPRALTLENIYTGTYLIFWGLFQKIFVADSLAPLVDKMFEGPIYSGPEVILGAWAFAFQIYGDFAGYSNIARGISKCMGIDIMKNFNFPYFSKNPHEFWNRWHISLSTWLRDYLYIPLGGNRKGTFITYRNLLFTMVLGGIWHGAAWTFVFWGIYQGLLLIVHRIFSPFIKKLTFTTSRILTYPWAVFKAVVFFQLVCFGWLIFRAESLHQLVQMTLSLEKDFTWQNIFQLWPDIKTLLCYSSFFVLVEFYQYLKDDQLRILKANYILRALFYVLCFYLLLFSGINETKAFIYFQF